MENGSGKNQRKRGMKKSNKVEGKEGGRTEGHWSGGAEEEE